MTALRVSYVLGTTAGGTGRHVAMLADGCLRAGMTVRVFGPEQTRQLFSPEVFAPVRITERPRPAGDLAALARLGRLLARAGPDVVHAHGLRAGALAALALARPGRPVPALVVTVHNGPPEAAAARLVYAVLERVVARRSDVVACVSADLAARMRRRGARRTELAVVPAPRARQPSAEAIALARAELDPAGRPVVLAVGRLTVQKGFDILLAAAARWQHRQPRPLLAIAGHGPMAASLAGAAAESGVAVRFLGQHADVLALLAVADVLAAPSRWDGQPLLLQEAMQSGTPIVASRVGGVPELTGGDAALLVPPEDPDGLAVAILRVLDDRELAGRLRSAAVTRAASLPSASAAIAAAIALYPTTTMCCSTSAKTL